MLCKNFIIRSLTPNTRNCEEKKFGYPYGLKCTISITHKMNPLDSFRSNCQTPKPFCINKIGSLLRPGKPGLLNIQRENKLNSNMHTLAKNTKKLKSSRFAVANEALNETKENTSTTIKVFIKDKKKHT
jgi:hypothetical protein